MNQQNFNRPKSSTGLEENIAGLLCYVGVFITGLVFFFTEKSSRFVKFHALQSILLFVSLAVVNIVLGWIPLIGWIVRDLVSLASFILWILLMVKAYQGDWFKLPIIGDIADRNAQL